MANVVVDNTIALIEGRPPVSCLNPQVLKKLFSRAQIRSSGSGRAEGSRFQ